MPGNSWSPFRRLTADEYAEAEEQKLREPPKEMAIAGMQDPTQALRSLGNYASKSFGGPSLDPVFDTLDFVSSARSLGAKSPSVLGRAAPVSGRVKATAGIAANPLLAGLKTAVVGAPPEEPKPYQPSHKEATQLREMMRELRGPKRLATKSIQPMQY